MISSNSSPAVQIPSVHSNFCPIFQEEDYVQSPDPAPLRMLAFSVAEAALRPDPYSPSFGQIAARLPIAKMTSPYSRDDDCTFVKPCSPMEPKRALSFCSGINPLWDVVERAKERRNREKGSATSSGAGTTRPTSHLSYKFVLPADSKLAASIASSPTYSPPRESNDHIDQITSPSVVLSTVSGPDHSPLAHTELELPTPSQMLRAQATAPSPTAQSRRLPSLAQINARIKLKGHRRNASLGSIPSAVHFQRDCGSAQDCSRPQTSTNDGRSFDIIGFLEGRRSATLPVAAKEPRLATFIRERTNGRLLRPFSMPPVDAVDKGPYDDHAEVSECLIQNDISSLTSATTRPDMILLNSPITHIWKLMDVIDDPIASSRHFTNHSPTSPTESVASTASLSPSLPMITCTPAGEVDSDEDLDNDVIVFRGEEEVYERWEKGRKMCDRLLHRTS